MTLFFQMFYHMMNKEHVDKIRQIKVGLSLSFFNFNIMRFTLENSEQFFLVLPLLYTWESTASKTSPPHAPVPMTLLILKNE